MLEAFPPIPRSPPRTVVLGRCCAAWTARRWRVDLSAVERCQRAQICLLSPSFERCRKRSEPKLNIYLPLVGGPTQTPHGSTAAEPAYANDWRIPI